jgi:hypothetical protein
MDRQLTTGHLVDLELPDGTTERRRALGLDVASGALVVADDEAAGGERLVHVADVSRVRLGADDVVGV